MIQKVAIYRYTQIVCRYTTSIYIIHSTNKNLHHFSSSNATIIKTAMHIKPVKPHMTPITISLTPLPVKRSICQRHQTIAVHNIICYRN